MIVNKLKSISLSLILLGTLSFADALPQDVIDEIDNAKAETDMRLLGGPSVVQTMHEDASDGDTKGWHIYDKWPSGMTVKNVNDPERGKVIKITGTISNGVHFLGWKDTNPILQWKMKADKWNIFYVAVMTKKGYRVLSYTPRSYDKGRDPYKQSHKIRLGLGSKMQDGKWHTFTRDIQADITKHEPDNKLKHILGIKIRGAGSYDDIKTISKKEKKVIVLNELKAFPTAEGAGAKASGGRGGEVIYVTNRKAKGKGSLRSALLTKGPRTILFAVGGRFNIDNGITLGEKKGKTIKYQYSNFTLAGQTANKLGGVHLTHSKERDSDNNVATKGASHFNVYGQENMVLRYFDSRYNWNWFLKRGLAGKEPTFRFSYVNDLIIDHVSSGWSSYGLIISQGRPRTNEHPLGNITVQRSLMHENVFNPSKKDILPEFKDVYQSNHSVGMLLGKDPGGWKWDKTTQTSKWISNLTKAQWDNMGEFTIAKNAFIGLSHRFPNTSGGENGKFRMVNNYHYGFKGDGTGERLGRIAGTAQNDFVNNVYQLNRVAKMDFTTRNLFGYLDNETYNGKKSKANLYAKGNLFLENDNSLHPVTSEISDNPYMMFHNRRGGSNKGNRGLNLTSENALLRNQPIPNSQYPVSLLRSSLVKENILNNVGGNVRFNEDGSTYIDDVIDKKYITQAKTNEGPSFYTKSFGDEGLGDTIQFKYPKDNYHYNADTTEEVYPKSFDDDLDGIPDDWEMDHQLTIGTKNNKTIRKNRTWHLSGYTVINNAGYTDLEMYLADIAGDFHMLAKEK